jgi:hypothetical protein
MRIEVDLSALKRIRWYEYALRFLFGGAVTVATGLVAQRYGPVLGGLFLAFPAIFPAGATLVEKHETEKKRRAGITDKARGRKAAALDARGAAMGSIALAGFGLFVWQLLPAWNAALCLAAALAAWVAMAVLIWQLGKYRHRSAGRDPPGAPKRQPNSDVGPARHS